MAFIGRLNRNGSSLDCEMFSGGRLKIKLNSAKKLQDMHEETRKEPRQPANFSNAYLKSCEPDGISTSNITINTNPSISSSELQSMEGTEASTLRCISPKSLDTAASTVMPDHSRSSHGDSYENEDEMEQVKRKTCRHNIQLGVVPVEKGSTISMCSWEEDEQPDEQDTQSFNVPPLELGSESASLLYEQQMHFNQLKLLRRSNEAYENWLSGKKRQFQCQLKAEREERELKQRQLELRQKLSEQRVQEWRRLKSRLNTNSPKRSSNSDNTTSKSRLDRARDQHIQNWKLKKLRQAEQQRQLEQREARGKQLKQEQRKQQAAIAWQQWMKGVAQRPKPVPLNQGLNSLRGTISNIYVNPNPWVHVSGETGI